MKNFLRPLLGNKRQRSGQTLVEYALLLTLVSIIVIVALTLLGSNIKTFFSTITSSMAAAS
jgi:Flp pilus assembly pilin Flp